MREKEKRLASQRVFLYNEIECFAQKEKTAVFWGVIRLIIRKDVETP